MQITNQKRLAARLLGCGVNRVWIHPSFVDQVASGGIHHVGVTLWRSKTGYELFLPRGFAESLWELLIETAEQFGLEIV